MNSIKFLREVVARRAAVVALVTGVLSVLVQQGIITPDLSARVTGWVGTAFVIAGLIAAVFVIRPKVTPVDDPRDNDGNHLVPEPNPEDVVAKADTTNQIEIQEEYDGDANVNSVEGETNQQNIPPV